MSDAILSLARSRPDAAVQLLFLHHAGGSSYPYLQLAQQLSGSIEAFCLELAGRGGRFMEPFQADAERTLEEALAAIERRQLGRRKPLLLFGHSLGGELAYQLAHRLRRRAPRLKLGLVLSARGFVDPDSMAAQPGEALSDADILQLLEQYEGTPPEVLADPEMRKYVIGVMRNDLALLASLSRLPKPALDVDAHLAGGDADSRVPLARLAGWRGAFAAPARQKIFAGGHFYLFASEEVIPWIEERARELAEYPPAGDSAERHSPALAGYNPVE
ncbi:thioesterase II family protein [Chromobacterium subtsugae]|uniref:thioesterase II family protein n=1 Tax=Chromobacterium subtsugae TaxID=251747 RepID=UPI00069A1ABD|nr:alpha/beta fold hydrolase [Chromobacterium subtsugae]